MVLEKTLESPSDSKEIKPPNPKENQPLIVTGRTDAEAPILWPTDAMSWLIGKDPDSGKDWRQKEKGTTEDEMVGWHHQLSACEFKQTLGDNEWQGSLVFMDSQRVRHDWGTEQQQEVTCLPIHTPGGDPIDDSPQSIWSTPCVCVCVCVCVSWGRGGEVKSLGTSWGENQGWKSWRAHGSPPVSIASSAGTRHQKEI